ncbi:MAG TPA: bifunctional phosphoglucose/phosphomannose isomerase [Actinomycetota bacterium]|nr:bifunctional phosphoglucose/phosphomannose isomerase [Actinomycetota bacterium]
MRVPIDDAATVGDPSGLLDAYLEGGPRLRAGYGAGRAAGPRRMPDARSVAFCAMGGSAAAGDAIAAALERRATMPMVTVRDYVLPAFCDERSVVVCLSYSGNTEETLSAFEEAVARRCSVVAVCSGGALAERAAEAGVPTVELPGDLPHPRAALGSLVGGALGALAAAGVLPPVDGEVADAAGALEEVAVAVGGAGDEAAAVAGWVGDRVPVVWSSGAVGAAAAWRWKAAFNENAKVPAFASVLPELDHHEIVGWSAGAGRGFAVVILRHAGEHPTVPARLRATIDAVRASGLEHREVRAVGRSGLAQVLSLMLLGDAASVRHAVARGVDPGPIDAIADVKRRIAGGA